VAQVAADCAEHDMLFMLEPLSYATNPAVKKLPAAEMRRVVVETARRLVIPGVDVLKAEFPLNVVQEPDEQVWAAACAELSAASAAPWVLLSASVDYDTYVRQVTIACQAGASGVAVGRAVWKEAAGLSGPERAAFLHGVAFERLQRITHLCNALARPWSHFYQPAAPDGHWYEQY
jgi:tagatose-1,6-bisphosphate aldolase